MLPTLFQYVGAAVAVVGVALWSLPAAFVVAGVGLLVAGLFIEGG